MPVEYRETVAQIVAAYVSNNHVQASELPALIASTHAAVVGLSRSVLSEQEPRREKVDPAQIRRSITPKALYSFLDGKPYQMLRRHLTHHGLTPEAYRARFGLPVDYPMVSATYSAQRAELSLQSASKRRASTSA